MVMVYVKKDSIVLQLLPNQCQHRQDFSLKVLVTVNKNLVVLELTMTFISNLNVKVVHLVITVLCRKWFILMNALKVLTVQNKVKHNVLIAPLELFQINMHWAMKTIVNNVNQDFYAKLLVWHQCLIQERRIAKKDITVYIKPLLYKCRVKDVNKDFIAQRVLKG